MNQWHPRTVYSKIKPDNRKSKSMAFKKKCGAGWGSGVRTNWANESHSV